MKEILTLLESNDVLLIAPPAWGKTRLLIELIKNSEESWIFVSPLRALANEFFNTISKLVPDCHLVVQRTQMQDLGFFKLLIVTPEVCSLSSLHKYSNLRIIFDEFHLVYYWGDSFRFHLIELYHWSVNNNISKLLLTATMTNEHLLRLKHELTEFILINLGNQSLKNLPRKLFGYLPSQKVMMLDILFASLRQEDQTILIFCKYREEVWKWLRIFYKLHIPVLGCVGGSSTEFQNLLQQRPDTRVIIATSALSHGVNLPPIHQIFLTYPLQNKDFWIQMVGRGGRRGENFSVHTMDFYEEYGRRFVMVLATLWLWIKVKIKMEIF